MDRGAWQATVHRVAESDMPELTHAHTHHEPIMYCELILIVTMQL